MPAILRLVDDAIWSDEEVAWRPLISHLVPVGVALTQRLGAGHSGFHYTVEIKKTKFEAQKLDSEPGVSETDRQRAKVWKALMTDRGRHAEGVPVRAIFHGASGGEQVQEATDRHFLKTDESLNIGSGQPIAWVPEVVRVQLGDPMFLELQLLTGRECDWIKTGLGPVEHPVFGAEWDVLCLDKRRPGGSDFHDEWTAWYQQQGMTQAFRTVLFYSSRDATPASKGEDAFLSKEVLSALTEYPSSATHGDGATRAILKQAREHLAWRTEEDPLDDLVLPEDMAERWKGARVAAELAGGVLIHGPSGTGKSAMARLIHRWSGRAPARFVYANCGALAKGDLARAELYGHVEGAFTDAKKAKLGLLTLADGGSLFLDEIHLLDEKAQELLLDVIDRKKFLPLGSTQLEHVDVRILCASNHEKVTEDGGPIRHDLRNRLFHSRIRLDSVKDFSSSDFRRLCEVCWDRLKESLSSQFGEDGRRALRSGHPELEDLKIKYGERTPRRSLLASARVTDRLRDLRLDPEGIAYLFESRHELASSNTRGLIAWLWRSMLRCPPGTAVVDRKVLEECSPGRSGLVVDRRSLAGAPALQGKILEPADLADDLFQSLAGKPGSTVDFTWSLDSIRARLSELKNASMLDVSVDRLCPFLLQAFSQLREKFKVHHVKWERLDRVSAPSPFNNKDQGFQVLIKAALPAFSIHEGDPAHVEAMRQFKEWFQRTSGRGRRAKTPA